MVNVEIVNCDDNTDDCQKYFIRFHNFTSPDVEFITNMSADQQLVGDAVKQKNASKKQSILQKLFAVWFDAFVYNQIWEDPRVDLEALQLDENSRVLTISSGGCNALNYLIENPESVTAVDLNRHHIYLLNLKIAALKFLPTYQDFFAFFGFVQKRRRTKLQT